jgi:hypothetical protein
MTYPFLSSDFEKATLNGGVCQIFWIYPAGGLIYPVLENCLFRNFSI